jgi:hypothetical protein
MNYTEQLRLQKLEEIERLIAEHNFHLELLLAQKEQLTPIVTEIKERHEKEKELKDKSETSENPVGSDGDTTNNNDRSLGTNDSVSRRT